VNKSQPWRHQWRDRCIKHQSQYKCLSRPHDFFLLASVYHFLCNGIRVLPSSVWSLLATIASAWLFFARFGISLSLQWYKSSAEFSMISAGYNRSFSLALVHVFRATLRLFCFNIFGRPLKANLFRSIQRIRGTQCSTETDINISSLKTNTVNSKTKSHTLQCDGRPMQPNSISPLILHVAA